MFHNPPSAARPAFTNSDILTPSVVYSRLQAAVPHDLRPMQSSSATVHGSPSRSAWQPLVLSDLSKAAPSISTSPSHRVRIPELSTSYNSHISLPPTEPPTAHIPTPIEAHNEFQDRKPKSEESNDANRWTSQVETEHSEAGSQSDKQQATVYSERINENRVEMTFTDDWEEEDDKKVNATSIQLRQVQAFNVRNQSDSVDENFGSLAVVVAAIAVGPTVDTNTAQPHAVASKATVGITGTGQNTPVTGSPSVAAATANPPQPNHNANALSVGPLAGVSQPPVGASIAPAVVSNGTTAASTPTGQPDATRRASVGLHGTGQNTPVTGSPSIAAATANPPPFKDSVDRSLSNPIDATSEQSEAETALRLSDLQTNSAEVRITSRFDAFDSRSVVCMTWVLFLFLWQEVGELHFQDQSFVSTYMSLPQGRLGTQCKI